MSWADFYRRRDAIDAALEHVREGRPGPLPLGVFSDEDELLLALHYKWLMALTGRMELALIEQAGDPVEAAARAWRACAADHGLLRRVLDEHADRPALRPAIDGEHRLVACLPTAPKGNGTKPSHGNPADRTAHSQRHYSSKFRGGGLATSATRASGVV